MGKEMDGWVVEGRSLHQDLSSLGSLSETCRSWELSSQLWNDTILGEELIQGRAATQRESWAVGNTKIFPSLTSKSICIFSRRKLGRGNEREMRWMVLFSQTFSSEKQVIYQSAVILPTVITLGLITSGEQWAYVQEESVCNKVGRKTLLCMILDHRSKCKNKTPRRGWWCLYEANSLYFSIKKSVS